jgi:hypothetical protein
VVDQGTRPRDALLDAGYAGLSYLRRWLAGRLGWCRRDGGDRRDLYRGACDDPGCVWGSVVPVEPLPRLPFQRFQSAWGLVVVVR